MPLIEQLNIQSDSSSGIFAIFLLLTIGTGLGLPRQIAAFTAGLLFNLVFGFALALIAATGGCMLTYYLSNFGLYQWLSKKYPHKTQKIQQFLADQTFVKALIIRILPLGSNFITNIVAGATRTPFIPFVSGTFVGFIPQMILFALLGSGVSLAAETQQQLTFVCLAVAMLLISWLFYQRRKSTSHTN